MIWPGGHMGLEALTSLAVANTLRALVLGGVTSKGGGRKGGDRGHKKVAMECPQVNMSRMNIA